MDSCSMNDSDALIEQIKNGIDYRLNDWLCEMKPDHDDSITGFNKAWDIVRKYFKERTTLQAQAQEIERLKQQSEQRLEALQRRNGDYRNLECNFDNKVRRITELEAEIERLKERADRDAAGELIVSLQRSIADLESNVAELEAEKATEDVLADCIMNYCNYPDCDYPDCCLPAPPSEDKT